MALHLAMAAPAAVAELKFDAGALSLLRDETQRTAVVRSMVALAHGWQARVVASGVDDLGTRAWLTGLGCDAAQGHACGHELPADQVPAWYALNRRAETGPAQSARSATGSRLGLGQIGGAIARARPH
jgi:EAL domain-containing protein (putative c-di-GMP-specific phosphodiesterase class I)